VKPLAEFSFLDTSALTHTIEEASVFLLVLFTSLYMRKNIELYLIIMYSCFMTIEMSKKVAKN